MTTTTKPLDMDPKQLTKHYQSLKRGQPVQVIGTGFNGRLGTIVDKDNAAKTVLIKFADTPDALPTAIDVRLVEHVEVDVLDQIHPMLAKSAEDFPKLTLETFLTSPDWVFEEKYDGERQVLRWCPERGFSATTRVVGKNTGRLGDNSGKLGHIRDVLQVKGTTVLDVEIFHAMGFQALRSIMGSDDEKALARQAELGYVYAIAFDVLWLDGTDLRACSFVRRRAVLEALFADRLRQQGPPAGSRSATWVPLWLSPVARDETEKVALLERVTVAGGEGVMAKRLEGTYTDTTVPGRRSPDVLKVKPFSETDVLLVGFEGGKGKYNQDKIGALQIAQFMDREAALDSPELQGRVIPWAQYPTALRAYGERLVGLELVSMGTCAGITQEQEEAFRKDPEKFLGMPIEISYQQRWPETGLFRHPNFRRLRDDKSPLDCRYDT